MMTEFEYQEIQNRLRNKLDKHPYRLSDRKSEAYEEAIRSAMSIISDVYHKSTKKGRYSDSG